MGLFSMSDNSLSEEARQGQPTKRNPVTTKRFRRESWWQITFPVLVTALVSLASVALIYILSGKAGVSVAADFSLILVILLNLLLGAFVLALVIGLLYLLLRLLNLLPPYANTAQETMQKVHSKVDQVTDKIAARVITIRSLIVGINVYLKSQGVIPDEQTTSGSGPGTDPAS